MENYFLPSTILSRRRKNGEEEYLLSILLLLALSALHFLWKWWVQILLIRRAEEEVHVPDKLDDNVNGEEDEAWKE